MALHVLLSCRICCYHVSVCSLLPVCSLLRLINEPWLCKFCCPAGFAVAMNFCLHCRVGMLECFMVCMSAVLLDILLLWSPHSVYLFAVCCASSMIHGFARPAGLQDLLLLLDFICFVRIAVWVCLGASWFCMSAVLLDMLLLWSPRSVYQFATCCASSRVVTAFVGTPNG